MPGNTAHAIVSVLKFLLPGYLLECFSLYLGSFLPSSLLGCLLLLVRVESQIGGVWVREEQTGQEGGCVPPPVSPLRQH